MDKRFQSEDIYIKAARKTENNYVITDRNDIKL